MANVVHGIFIFPHQGFDSHTFHFTSSFQAKYIKKKLVKMISDTDVIIIEGTIEDVYYHPLVHNSKEPVMVLESRLPIVAGIFELHAYWNRERLQSFAVRDRSEKSKRKGKKKVKAAEGDIINAWSSNLVQRLNISMEEA